MVSPNNNTTYEAVNGTSAASPMMGCGVACLVQAHPEWTVEQMRAPLFTTGRYYGENRAPDPLFVHGFGIADTFAAHNASLCSGQEIFKLKCRVRKGSNTVQAKLKKGQAYAVLTFRLDDDNDSDTETDTNRRGKTKVKFLDIASGPHTVEILQCDVDGQVDCP